MLKVCKNRRDLSSDWLTISFHATIKHSNFKNIQKKKCVENIKTLKSYKKQKFILIDDSESECSDKFSME